MVPQFLFYERIWAVRLRTIHSVPRSYGFSTQSWLAVKSEGGRRRFNSPLCVFAIVIFLRCWGKLCLQGFDTCVKAIRTEHSAMVLNPVGSGRGPFTLMTPWGWSHYPLTHLKKEIGRVTNSGYHRGLATTQPRHTVRTANRRRRELAAIWKGSAGGGGHTVGLGFRLWIWIVERATGRREIRVSLVIFL